ncbi:MAG: hypothetical protein ACFB15_21775 [Cyclobacteriaceae bacterium]
MLLLSILAALLFYPPESPETAPENLFDFWVGEWNLTWQDAQGQTQKGYNRIVKILDDQVIQENFKTISTSVSTLVFKGMSLSVYNPRTEQWHQAWADNQGGYYNFTGEFEDDKRMFITKTTNQQGKEIIQRMVFRDITQDAFVWDWESSEDSGQTWQLNWQIHYQRKK